MLDEVLNKEEVVQNNEEETTDAVTKRKALYLFASRSKLESLRFFIV